MPRSRTYFQLSIIIPTLNNFVGLSYQLNYFKNKPYKIVIVDNAPDEKKRKLIKKFKNPPIAYLPQKKNLGFAGAMNLAAKYVDSQWTLILNDDIKFRNFKLQTQGIVEPIERLIKYAKKKDLQAVSPVLINPKGEVENYGYYFLPYGKVRLIKKTKDLNKVKIDGLTAACLLIKTSVFKDLDGFDESFFAYLEDVEFFLRFKKADYKLGIDLNTQVIHYHMATSQTMGSFKARQDVVNWWRLFFKHKDRFRFDFIFLLERLRNVLGLVKKEFFCILLLLF